MADTGIPRPRRDTLNFQGGRWLCVLFVWAASLDLTPIQNRWTGKLEVVAEFMAADGSTVGDRPALARTVDLNFSQPTYDAATQRGLRYRNELKIPAQAVQFRILIANMATGKIGTVTIPLSEVGPAERF